MLLKALQLSNALSSICITVFGTTTLIRELHPEKAPLPIFNKRFDKPIWFKDVNHDGSETFTKPEHPANAPLPIEIPVLPFAIETFFNEEHCSNAL